MALLAKFDRRADVPCKENRVKETRLMETLRRIFEGIEELGGGSGGPQRPNGLTVCYQPI